MRGREKERKKQGNEGKKKDSNQDKEKGLKAGKGGEQENKERERTKKLNHAQFQAQQCSFLLWRWKLCGP